jgi:putative colanic acid biosynthesis acetyltransferase WcaF
MSDAQNTGAGRRVDLSTFSTGEFDRGAGPFKEALWLIVSRVLFHWCPFSLSSFKRAVLRLFGAHVGKGVVIKPEVKITFPWKLNLGNHVWLGEESWLLNLAPIIIADHACISQRAVLCTGNHNYTSPAFDLMTAPIQVGQGAWIGANAFVGPGVCVGSYAVLTAGSIATKDLETCGVYQGNPAVQVRQRRITAKPVVL